ncbi:heterokaryon incompatibility protein-domain-containing protein [Xylariales sp. AK1849]|nr:heterokaryon incompatibility protein-domain-containing protein [Xylariales sp. AK1849]
MGLCSLCSKTPFADLPDPQKPWASSRVADDTEMIEFYWREEGRQDPLGFPWHEDLDALATSAKSCKMCTVVQAGAQVWLDRYRTAEKTNKHWMEFREDDDPIPSGQRLWLTKRFGGAEGFDVFVEVPNKNGYHLITAVAFSVEKENEVADLFSLRPMEPHSASPASLDVVTSWLEHCVNDHEQCSKEEMQLPSRVLDVGGSNESIKLVDGARRSGKYICLSYCWGSSVHFTTSRETIEARQSGISLSDLPKTLLDAVKLTRHLGIRYLWIDSLCICQGDADDWARESARMIDVYSHAYLVIAANHASDKSVGFFHARQPRAKAIVDLPGYGDSSARGVNAMLVSPSDEWTNGGTFDGEPLTSRGWALQERLIARRVLHYNSKQMYFECGHGIVGEDGCRIEARQYDLTNRRPSRRPFRPLHGGDHETWNQLLWAYGKRELSRPTDKLPAISGLASYCAKKIAKEYVAGIWSNAIVEGIAWQGLGNRRAVATSEHLYIGPSWSWASYDGIAATGLYTGWTDIAKIEEWHVDLKNEANPYGEVKDAWLRVHGPMTQLTPREKSDVDHEIRLKRAGLTPRPKMRRKYPKEEGCPVALDYMETIETEEWRGWDPSVLILGGYPKKGELWIKGNVSDAESDSEDDHSGDYWYGLVVVPVRQGEGENKMKRVGWMFLDGDEVAKVKKDREVWRTITLY